MKHHQYLRARYYDPTTSQFLTVDPKFEATESPYGYVFGSPTALTDPSGECCKIPFTEYCIDLNDPDCDSSGNDDLREGLGQLSAGAIDAVTLGNSESALRITGYIKGNQAQAERAIKSINKSSSAYRIGFALGRSYTATWVWRDPLVYTGASSMSSSVSCITGIASARSLGGCAETAAKSGLATYFMMFAPGAIMPPVVRQFLDSCFNWLIDGS